MANKIFKVLCVFFLLPVLFLTGCGLGNNFSKHGNDTDKSDIMTDFSADFTAQYREMKIKGHMSCNRQKMVNISINSPESLSGLELNYKSSQMQIIRDNMICSADEAYIPEKSFPNILRAVIFGVSDGRAVFKSEKDNQNTYDLKTGFGNADITADSDGRLLGARLDGEQFEIKFENIKINMD